MHSASRKPPPRLISSVTSYDKSRLDTVLSQIEYQIDDELSANPPVTEGVLVDH